MPSARRFPPPWIVDEHNNACFIVKDATGQARRMAANFAKLPELLRRRSVRAVKRLRLVSEPVKRIDAGIRKLVEDMFQTQYDAPGLGLAAIQVGVAKRWARLVGRQDALAATAWAARGGLWGGRSIGGASLAAWRRSR
jgi:hypothetical protein